MLTVCANVCCKIARARYCHTKPNSRCSSVKDPKCSTGEAQNLTAPAKLRPDQYGEWYDGIIVWHQPQPCCQHFLFQRYLLVCQTHLLCAAYLQIVSHLPSMYHTSHVCVILCYSMCVSSTVYITQRLCRTWIGNHLFLVTRKLTVYSRIGCQLGETRQ